MSEEFDIEKLLKEHLLDEREAPPVGLFDQIDAQIMGDKRKKRFFFLPWFGLGVLILVGLVAFGIHYNWQSSQVVLDETTKQLGKEVQKEPNNHNNNNNTPFHATDKNITGTLTDSLTENIENQEMTNLGSFPSNTQYVRTKQNTSTSSTITSNRHDTNDLAKSDQENKHKSLTATNTSNQIGSGQNESSTINKTATDTSIVHDDVHDITSNSDNTDNTNTSNQAEKDSTLVVEVRDSIQLAQETDSTLLVENEPPSLDSIPDSTAITPPEETTDQSKFGAILYGGPGLFNVAVFKPYFSSGALSSVSFPSSNYEFGLGVYRRIKKRFSVQALFSYNALQTEFTYDLLVGEADFLSLYESEEPIPIENLDNPETCNCYLVDAAFLSYKISSFAFTLSTSYDLIARPKFTFGPSLGFSGILTTKFTNQASSAIEFSEEHKEQFKGSRLEVGLGFHYRISDHFQVGFTPSYGFQFTKKSTIYAKNINRFLIPLSLKIGF